MKRLAKGFARGVGYGILTVSLLVVVAVGATRYWLPQLGGYKPEVERLLSDYLGQEIMITSLSAEWEGIDLTFKAGGVRVAVSDYPGSGMRFDEIFVSLDPLDLIAGRRTFDNLKLTGATIEVSRLADGRFRVGDTIIGQPRGVLKRLLQGRSLEISDSTMVWRDALAPGDEMKIENVDIRIRSRGHRRRFEFEASAPEDLMHALSAQGSYDPQSLTAGAWTVAANISIAHLNLTRIPTVIQEQLPWQSHGFIDTEFRARWNDGVLKTAAADLTAYDFIIPYARDKKPLSARRFTSSVAWRRSQDDWRLVFNDPEILLDETPVSVSRFEVQRRDAERTYTGRDVNVQDLLGVVNRLDIELPWKALIDRLHPRGIFSRAALTLTGPYLEARDWRFEGEFRNVGWRAQERYPGVQGLDGRMTAGDKGGELRIKSSALELDAAHSMRGPVAFNRVEGNVEWYRLGRDWVVDVGDGIVSNGELSLSDINFYTRVPDADGESPFMLVRCRVDRADVQSLRNYLPVKRMSDKQTEWLDRALAGGEITRGRFYLNGPLGAFPYRNGEGELRVSARISDGVLDFHEKWPDLTGLDGEIDVNNARFEARANSGAMMNSAIHSVRVRSEDFFRRDRVLAVEAELSAKADDVVQFLRRGPLNKNPPPAYSRMLAGGEGALSMSIELPFTRLKEDSRVDGTYTFEDASVEVREGVTFNALSGTVHFTDSTVSGEDLKGRVFGGPLRADLTTVKAGRPMTFAITGTGEADVDRLEPVVGPVLVSRLRGRAQWEGRFEAGPGPNKLEVRSRLKGVDILLPDPLWKPVDTEAQLMVGVEFDRAGQRIDLELEDGMKGTLHYGREDGRSVLLRGALNLGADLVLPDRELVVAVKDDHIDMDQWIKEVTTLQRLSERIGGDPDRDKLFDHLRSLVVDVDRFRYLHRNLGPVEMHAATAGDKRWTVQLDGPRVAGTGEMRLDVAPARYRFDMSRLYWPRLKDVSRATAYESLPEPSEFAHLVISAEDFRYDEMQLGRLKFEGAPDKYQWRIRKLSLQQPDFRFEATGGWSMDQFGTHRSQVEITAESEQLGETLAHLGLAGQVANGSANLTAELGWPGEPGDFSLRTLNGELSFAAKDGRFLKLEPGSGRLLGLFNAEALTRRFKLDFTDVFKEGFAFDSINGDAEISAGRLKTDDIFVLGPAALLNLSGAVGLWDETYDLRVTVAPQLAGNLSLAGAIANPAAGAMIFVVQKLFKKQMAKLINYKYRITGDWDAPRVEPVAPPARDASSQMGRN